MRTAGIRPGDIIRAENLHAVVIQRDGRVLLVKGIGNGSLRRVRANEVDGHWRQVKARVKA
jgi:hypothetical protein